MPYTDKELETIYLQIDPYEDGESLPEEGVTWCIDRINDTDIKYIRADLVEKIKEGKG
jgi:hypothetical protein